METNNPTGSGRTAAIIAYLTLIGTIISFYMNQDEKKTSLASFHIRQALGIHISFYILGALVSLFDPAYLFCFLYFYTCIMGVWTYNCTST